MYLLKILSQLVKLIHGGESIDILQNYGSMLETHLKLPGQVDHVMNPGQLGKLQLYSFIRKYQCIFLLYC